ncbi:hypothetical protein ACFQZC_36415 [Streptacidiphilus monticola]
MDLRPAACSARVLRLLDITGTDDAAAAWDILAAAPAARPDVRCRTTCLISARRSAAPAPPAPPPTGPCGGGV